MKFGAFMNWFRLADYDAAKAQATEQVIARYARGNIAFQNGACLDDEQLQELSAEGDKAMARLKRAIPAAAW